MAMNTAINTGRPMKIVVLGTRGRLGAALAKAYWSEGHEVLAFDRVALDITEPGALEKTLGGLAFDVLLNASAQANVDECERHPEAAFAVNTKAVGALGELCARKKVRCIHFSTDYVFDGERGKCGASPRPYTEEDVPAPISIYGESKHLGELALLAASSEHLVVRISWVFGSERPGFVEQTIERALQGGALEGVEDKWSVPTSVFDIASELRPFMRELPVGGVLHLTQSGGGCTWRGYAQAVVQAALKVGLPLQSTEVRGRKLAEIAAFVGRRPVYTVMATQRLEALTGRSPRSWQEALEEFITTRYVRS